MEQSHYLIVGASHAALAALHAIRLHDADKDITIITRDDSLPYSPTVLPYVVSGRSDPKRVFLRDADYFAKQKVNYRPRAQVASLGKGAVRLVDGEEIGFEKLLLATGAAPVLPSIPGLLDVRFHVLRTLNDALALRQALPGVKKALVLGGGLIGMHAAENLAAAGAEVTVVEQERHILPAYFDADAAAIIEKIFAAKGVRILTGARIAGCAPRGSGCYAALEKGGMLEADLLLVATGVAPVTDFLDGSGVATDRGVLVDDTMSTSVENVWAAGDVAQARGFFSAGKIINGILPDAVDQGRIAGMAMAGDPQLTEYAGGVPLNTYTFFGQQAASIGVQEGALGERGVEVHRELDAEGSRYLKIVLEGDRLAGIFAINGAFDPGVMWELILRRVDLGAVKQSFLASPQQTARAIMSKTWR